MDSRKLKCRDCRFSSTNKRELIRHIKATHIDDIIEEMINCKESPSPPSKKKKTEGKMSLEKINENFEEMKEKFNKVDVIERKLDKLITRKKRTCPEEELPKKEPIHSYEELQTKMRKILKERGMGKRYIEIFQQAEDEIPFENLTDRESVLKVFENHPGTKGAWASAFRFCNNYVHPVFVDFPSPSKPGLTKDEIHGIIFAMFKDGERDLALASYYCYLSGIPFPDILNVQLDAFEKGPIQLTINGKVSYVAIPEQLRSLAGDWKGIKNTPDFPLRIANFAEKEKCPSFTPEQLFKANLGVSNGLPRTGLKAQAVADSLAFVDFSLFFPKSNPLKTTEKLMSLDEKMHTPVRINEQLRNLCEIGSSDDDILGILKKN